MLCMGVFVGTSVAHHGPVIRLVPPFYSFDRESATIDPEQKPETDLHAYDILKLVQGPEVSDVGRAVPGADLGLEDPADELNALSSGNPGLVDPPGLGPNVEFMLLFSIDQDSAPTTEPDKWVRGQNVPYNAQEQAEKGHAAGDQYMALDKFTRKGGPMSGDGGSRVSATSVQLRNQYNEGGSDFGGEPERGSGSGARSEGPFGLDDVVSMMLTGRSAVQYTDGLTEAYFSVKAGSPSLNTLPGYEGETANAAYIFYYDANADPTPAVFATSAALGLTPDDDIDAMIVFDTNNNHVFDEPDQVLFSLTATSPSLGAIGGGSVTAADVFTVWAVGDLNPPHPSASLFASADNLGLLATDNVDALDYFVCMIGGNASARACAGQYGIRGHRVPGISDWGLVVFTLLVLVTGALVIRRRSSRVA